MAIFERGRFWELYGNAEEGEGSAANVVLALDVLGSFDFYSIPASSVGGYLRGMSGGEGGEPVVEVFE